MIERVPIRVDEVAPSFPDVLRGQGIPPGATVRDTITALVEASLRILSAEARPACIAGDVSRRDFADIFRGEGRNDEAAPLGGIYPQADRLVLFALTMGQDLSRTITECFDRNDFALGSMLDTVASLAVENAIGLLERRVTATPAGNGAEAGDRRTLNYSPGYCGWHLGAQRKLFRYLHPEQVGITLNESCLMTPLKSASGVLVHGARAIHEFEIGFHFCRACKGRTCLERRDRSSAAGHPTP